MRTAFAKSINAEIGSFYIIMFAGGNQLLIGEEEAIRVRQMWDEMALHHAETESWEGHPGDMSFPRPLDITDMFGRVSTLSLMSISAIMESTPELRADIHEFVAKWRWSDTEIGRTTVDKIEASIGDET